MDALPSSLPPYQFTASKGRLERTLCAAVFFSCTNVSPLDRALAVVMAGLLRITAPGSSCQERSEPRGGARVTFAAPSPSDGCNEMRRSTSTCISFIWSEKLT
ncbi:hypothetical protein L596_010061 [Steinernema carpocapsae]|uniref:Uncharacterized protein n=1 Tax=Steinernema carpocapsae TaxID=34508 RepID=A0A4U5PHP6_STECR|nr:hypothetical protein L596_010061 [Steinernema carpocapsae]